MTQATCSTGLLSPGSPYFQSNKVKRVARKPSEPPASVGCKQPWGFLFCCLCRVTHFFPVTKALWRVRLSPQIKDFVHQKKTNSSFQNILRSAFVSIWISQSKKLNMRFHLGSRQATTAALRKCLFRYSRYFPTPSTQYLLDHSQHGAVTHIKTSSSCGHIQMQAELLYLLQPADAVRKEPFAMPCGLLSQEKQTQHSFKSHL